MQTQTSFYRIRPELLVDAIETQGLKRWWVAEILGIHKTTLRRWLKGRTRYMKRKNAERISELLELPLARFAEPLTVC